MTSTCGSDDEHTMSVPMDECTAPVCLKPLKNVFVWLQIVEILSVFFVHSNVVHDVR